MYESQQILKYQYDHTTTIYHYPPSLRNKVSSLNPPRYGRLNMLGISFDSASHFVDIKMKVMEISANSSTSFALGTHTRNLVRKSLCSAISRHVYDGCIAEQSHLFPGQRSLSTVGSRCGEKWDVSSDGWYNTRLKSCRSNFADYSLRRQSIRDKGEPFQNRWDKRENWHCKIVISV